MKGGKRKLKRGNKSLIREFNHLWDFVYKWTLVGNLPGWTETPSGLVPPPPGAGESGTYTPPLSPIFTPDDTSPTMGITPGWVNGPTLTTSGDYEIPQKHLSPHMPTISGVRLDDGSPNSLTMHPSETNYIYLKIDLTAQDATIGGTVLDSITGVDVLMTSSETSISIDSGGAYDLYPGDSATGTETAGGTPHSHTLSEVNIPSHSHTVTDNGHQHEAIVRLSTVVYTFTNAPSFVLNTTGFPDDTETIHYVPWGKYVLNTAGDATTDEWYRHDHLDYFPPQYTVGGETGADRPVNPRAEGE